MARLAWTSEPLFIIIKFWLSCSLLTFHFTDAGPTGRLRSSQCASFCKDAKNFQYELGTTYAYDFATDIQTSVLEGSQQKSQVRITATVEIEALSSCDLKLQLRNINFQDLTQTPGDYGRLEDASALFREQKEKLEAHSMVFAFQDGKVEEICTNEMDEVWVLNVKRGVVSMIQNSMEDLSLSGFVHETDISGRCPTEYILDGEGWGGGVSYKKIKDLTKCSSRQTQLSAIQSVPYSSSSPVQNIPLLTGKVECTQTVRNKKVEQVLCQEEQRFQPFESKESGAVTNVVQSLTFISERASPRFSEENRDYLKKSLLFEEEEPFDGSDNNSKELLEFIELLDAESFPQVKTTAPKLFTNFISQLKRSSESSLKTTFEQTRGSPKQKYFMEALPLVGTASSLAFLRDLMLENALESGLKQSWLTSLAFIKHPTLEMIKAVSPLITENDASMETLLGVSSLINSYCRYHPTCNQDVTVNDILEKLTSFLGSSCGNEHPNVENIRQRVLRLKAIGNTGVLPISEEMSKTPTIIRCFTDRANPTEVRLAAIDSLRRMKCGAYDSNQVLHHFTQVNENTEIRIQSFLTIMKCTNRHTIELVKSILYTEPVNQVASFVWTYLTNLQETSRPEKQQIRELLSNEFLKNKFSTDARKFSRNYEASTYSEEYNVGAGLDSNIIFTEESFLPKSGMFNLTLQLFGESVNIMEFGLRSHGMEQLLEKVFGPQGYFPDNRVTDFLQTSRVKRDSSTSDRDGLSYLYDQAKPEDDVLPGGSIYTRMFGHEILYKNFEISDKTPIPNVVDESGQSLFNIRHVLDNLSTGKKSEFSKSMILLDTSYSVPTISGFSLDLGVHAAATMALIAKGKFNVGRFVETKELDIHGSLRPSAMIDVDGTLAVKLGSSQTHLKTGLKLHNKLHSSTAVELNLLIKGKNVLHASVNVPQNKHEIIDVSSELLLLGPSGEALIFDETDDIDMNSAYVSDTCSSDYINQILGMKLCMETFIPNKLSLTPVRPTYFKVYFEKIDEFTGYTVDYRYDSDETTTKVNCIFDTPGSSINRRIAGDFLFDKGMGKIAAGLESISTALRAEGIYSQFQKNLELSLVSHEKTSFLLSMGVRSDGNTMKPHFLITWQSRPVVDLKGSIEMTPQLGSDDKISIAMNLKHLTETPVKVVGEITGSGEVRDASLTVESYIVTGNIRSLLKRKAGHWSTKTTMEYSWMREKLHSADFSAKIQRTRKGSLTKTLLNAGFTSTQFPDNSLDFHWETQTSNGFCENRLKTGWGKTTWEGHTLFSSQNSIDHSELRLESSLICSKFNIDYRFEFANTLTTESWSTKLLSRLGSENEFNANIDYVSGIDDLIKKTLEAEATWPNTEYSFKASFIEKQRGDFEAEVLVHLNSTRDLKATALYMNRSNNLKLEHNIEFRARGFTSVPLAGSISFSATEKQSHIGCQVQFEGNKQSRISVSLDYSHTRFSHKIEGKVTLNEKKYNGEVLYVTNPEGMRNVTVDLHLESHIYLEAMLSGMLPNPMLGKILIVPDKDNHPETELKIEANLDPSSVSVALDYFGEQFGFFGRYDVESIVVEVLWLEENKVMLSISLPKFSLEEARIEVDILTPFEGYKNMSLTIEHIFDGENLKTSVNGGIGHILGDVNLAATVKSLEASISSDMSITGYPRYQGNFLILRKNKRKSFQFMIKAGDKESLLDFDFIRLDEGYVGKFDFYGFFFLPNIAMEINHQLSTSRTSSYHTTIEWAADSNEPQKIVLRVTHENNPLSVFVSLTTPWIPLKIVETSMMWDPDGLNHQFSLTAKQDAENITTRIQIQAKGGLHDFNHELDGEWLSYPIRFTISGGLNGSLDSNLHIILKLPDHHIGFDLLSKKESNKYIGEFMSNLDDAITSAGIKWDFSSEITSEKIASIWGRIPRYEPVSASLEYDSNGNQKTVKVKVNKQDETIIDIISSWQISGTRFWTSNLILKSEVALIPSISFTSAHNMIDMNKISHITRLQLIPLDGENSWMNKFWKVHHVSVDVSMENLENIKGTLIFGEKDFVVDGKIDHVSQGYRANIKISSNQFHELLLKGQYTNENELFSIVGELFRHDGERILHLKMDAQNGKTEKMINLILESLYTPSLEAYVGIASGAEKNFTVYILKNAENLLHFYTKGHMSPSTGTVEARLTSSYFHSINLLQLDFNYGISGNGVNGKLKFQDNTNVHEARIDSMWNDDSKRATVSYNGLFSLKLECTVEGLSQLVATAIYNDEKLGEVSISYRPEQGDYSLGKHGVYITYESSGTSHNFNFVVGLDPKKIFVNVQTPFENWTDIVIDGRISSSSISKGIKFILQREEDKLQGSFESKNSRKTGTLQLSSEISVVGFSELRQILLETAKATKIQGLSAFNPQKFTVLLTWATSSFNVKVESPVNALKKLAVSGNWDFRNHKKFIEISGNLNANNYTMKMDTDHDNKNCKGKLILISDVSYGLEFGYDFTESYETSLVVETPNRLWNLGAKVKLDQDSLSVHATTPVQRYESVSLSILRESLEEKKGVYRVSWDVNGKSDKIEVMYEADQGRIELRALTPIKPWNSVVVTIIYDIPLRRLTLHSQRGDGQEVKLNFEMESKGNMTAFENPASSHILVAIETPVQNYKKIQFFLSYNRNNFVHMANISISRNGGETEGKLNLLFRHSDPVNLDISADLASPILSSKATAHASLLVDPSGESTVSAHVQANGKRYEMYGLSQLTNSITKLEMRTSLPFLRQFRFSLMKGSTINLHGSWSGNNKEVEVQGDLLCGGLKSSRINFNVSTPLDIMGSFGFEGEISKKSGSTSALLIFQNHEVRWLAKLDRLQDYGKEDWRVQVNTPLQGYKHVVVSLKHLVNSHERNVDAVVQLNQKELSLRSTLRNKKLTMVVSSGLSYLPMQANIESNWENDLILKIATSTGNHEYGTSFSLDLQGVTRGNFDFAISSIEHLDTKLDWKFEGDSRQGRGLVNIKNKMIGSKSVRSSWKNNDWEEVETDLWVKTGSELHEKGVALKYKVTRHESYGSVVATANYDVSEGTKSITFEATLDEQSSNVNFDMVLTTPFEEFHEFKAKGEIKMKNEIGFVVDATLNQEKLVDGNLNLVIKPLQSQIKIELDLPMVTDPINLDAFYDMTKEKKLISVVFKQNVYRMDLKLEVTIPYNSNLVHVKLEAQSTVPTLTIDVSGMLRVEYAVNMDGTRKISLYLNGNEIGDWKLLANLRPSYENFHSKVTFEGPFSIMPSLMAEMNYKSNPKHGISGDFTAILEGSEVTASIGINQKELIAAYTYTISTTNVQTKGNFLLDCSGDEKKLELSYTDGQDYTIMALGNLILTPETRRGSGSVKVISGSNTEVPISFEVAVDNHGNILLAGSSHERNVKVEGDLKGMNGNTWWEEGESIIKVVGNMFKDDEITSFTLETRHFIKQNEYSLNGTAGEQVKLNFYVRTGSDAALYAKLKWFSSEEAVLDVTLQSSNVNAYIHLAPKFTAHYVGEYGTTPNSAFVNSVLHLNGKKFNFNASLAKDGNRSVCKALLENPSVKQKLYLEIITVLVAPQNLEGTVIMNINEQDFSVFGALKTQVFDSTRGEKYIERVLQLSSNITTFELTTVGLELFLRKPLKAYNSLNVVGTLSVNDDVSTISGGYELPSFESGGATGLFLKIESSLLSSDENYEFFLKTFGKGFRKIEGKLNYKTTRLDVIWDFVMPTSVITLSFAGKSDDGDQLLFQVESVFNPSENIQLTLNCHGWDTHYIFKTSMTSSSFATVGYLFIDAPRLFSSVNEYKVTVTTNSDGSYTLESSAVRGRLVMELIGDATIAPTNANVVLKAMGSYGSHYAMLAGNKNEEGKYAFELTAESSSLLSGKRVNVRGNVTIEDNIISTVLQCRALRNIHELTMTLTKTENGNGKILVNLDSQSLDPAKLEAEWSSEGQGRIYFGKLMIQLFNQNHEAEFGINLKDFEGKLHISSPFLPSKEFNFHLKSIVNSKNINLLGDIRIRGSHWRLEGVAAFVNLRNMEFKIEARTPFQFMDRITLGVTSNKEEVYMEIYTPADYIPNVMLSLGGMQALEKGSWYELKPNLIISLPSGKYAVTASMEIPKYETAGVLHLLLVYTGAESQTLECFAEISPLKVFKLQMEHPGNLKLRLVTPFEILSQVKLEVEGEIDSKRSGKLLVTGALNTYEGRFDSSFDNSNGNMQAVTRLTTNIPHYEKSAFAIAIETFQGIGNGKSFHVEFRKPDWENLFRLDADYRYNFESLTELEGEVNVNMDSYMNLPPLHAHVKSGMKNGRYGGAIEGNFGQHRPSLKVEIENLEGSLNVFVEGKAGENDRYNLMNIFEMIPSQNSFSFRENLHWNGGKVVDMVVALSDHDQLLEAHLHASTPWGPIHSKAALTPITFLTMENDISLIQLLKNANVTMEVMFKERKLVGLEIVSRDGMRLFEVHNPIRPVSLSVAVEKVDWNSLRIKAGVCWDLNVPEKSSLGVDAYMYRRSTGFTLGGYIAGAQYGIVTAKFEHFLISSRLGQKMEFSWNGFAGRVGNIGYVLNITNKSLGFKRKIEYGLQLIAPSRSILISGGSHFSEDKHSIHNIAIEWDAFREPEKRLSFNISFVKSTTWRTMVLRDSLEIHHFSWDEPVVFLMEKTMIHDSLKQFELKIKPSSNIETHFTMQSYWESGDWSSFAGSVVQPSSKIEIKGNYNITDQAKSFHLSHMLSSGETKMFAVNLEKIENTQQILLQAGDINKPRTFSSFSSVFYDDEYFVKGSVFSYQVAATFRSSLPYLDLLLRNENANKMHVICGLPHPKEIVFRTSRTQYTQIITDVNFLVRLNSTNLLSTRIHWRPELLDEISDYDWLKRSKDLLADLLPSFSEVSIAVRNDFEGHWNLFSPPVKSFFAEFYRISLTEVNIIIEDAQYVYYNLKELYDRNAFYIRDVLQVLNESFSPLQIIGNSLIRQAKEMCKTICYYVANSRHLIIEGLIKYYGRLEVHIMKSWEDVEEFLTQFWNSNAEWLQTVSEELEEFIDAFIEALEGRIELLETKLMAVGFIKNLVRLYQEYATWLDELPIDDYMSAIEDFFQIKVLDKLEALFGQYFEVVGNALNADYIKELLETPPIPYIRFMLRQTKNGLVRIWELIEIEVKLKDLVRHALKNVDILMQRNFPSWEIEWDPYNGVIQYDQSLSIVEWVDFTQAPHWKLQSEEKEQVNQITNLYYQIMDYIENLKPFLDMRIRDILPPFGGLAMMAGDYHYYTFDKKYFRFAGECSYVLIADLLHNGFSFIVNYETRDGAIRKKSYSIALPENMIEFDTQNFKVTVDSRKVELPVRVGTVYIRRQETRLDVYDTRGYQISCTLSPSVCTFSTSGWYYGKLGGLLGTYDNEYINDFQSPDGQIISDIPTFAYSWRVGTNRNQCRMKNFAKDDVEPVDVDNICYDLLGNRKSPLRPCFNTVDTTIFMEMCKFDVSRNMNSASRSESACTSMSAYVTECQKHNVDVWMPPTCVRCKLEDGTALTTGENATLETNGLKQPPSSSDVVILLEEKECMDQIDLSMVVSKLEVALKSEGLTDNRYAIVGFGGNGIHFEAHLQTSYANVWSHSTLFKVPEKLNDTENRKSDLYSAIHFASTMTYRAGVSKTLIAITCGDEDCGDSVRYADTLTLLVENDFRLHMLTPKPFTLKGNKKQDETNRILGVDANGVYTTHHAKRGPLEPDPSFKRYLNLPKDLCTPLATETNGTRFTTNSLSKKELDVWARRVSQTSHPSDCQRCECVPDRNGGSRLMCHQCVSPSLWKFLEEWKSYQDEEVDELFGIEILESEPFLLPPN